MENNLMTFSSMTAVMKARELLRRNGIRAVTTPEEDLKAILG